MIQVALVGCGHWGVRYVRTIERIEGVQLRWVCTRRGVRPDGGFPPGCRFTDDYRRILEHEATAAIVIATPPAAHYEIAKAALEAGRDVLVEKPMTCNSEEALDLCESARQRSRILMVGHTFLYNPAVVELKKRIDAGEFGGLCYLLSRRLGMGPLRSDVSALWNLAPHDISIMNYLVGGPPATVSARGSSFLTQGIEDVAELTLHYDGGVTGAVWVSSYYPQKIRETAVIGREKMAVFDDMADTRLRLYDVANLDHPETPQLSQLSPLESQCRHFLACVTTREAPLTDGHEGYVNVRILEAAQRSMEAKTGVAIGL